jgi:hypothetical protein
VALGGLAALACSGGRPAAAPPLPEHRIAFVAHDTLRALVQLPYDQPFAWVEPSRMFKGLYERDDQPVLAADVSGLRKSILIPLEALGWYEVPEREARYFVTALVAERTVLQTNYRMKPVEDAGTNPADWHIDRLSDRPSSGNALPVGRVYRGYAILSRSGEVHARVFGGDRHTAEAAVGADIIEKVMGRAP